MKSDKWDTRFLEVAKLIASWSKDPSTQVGAVIVKDRHIVSTGYNGFPMGVRDLKERYLDRETKLSLCVHAEQNAILRASGESRGSTIYVYPLGPCTECCKSIIQSGIVRVAYPNSPVPDRWKYSIETANMMFKEAKVEVNLV